MLRDVYENGQNRVLVPCVPSGSAFLLGPAAFLTNKWEGERPALLFLEPCSVWASTPSGLPSSLCSQSFEGVGGGEDVYFWVGCEFRERTAFVARRDDASLEF